METTFTRLSSNQVKLAFVVEPETFEKGIEIAYNKLKGRVNIPGFRKGHAPRKVIEMHYGVEMFYEDAFDAIFPDLYKQAVAQYELNPVDRPEIEVGAIERGKPLEFTCTVYVYPEVTLGQYKGIVADRVVNECTEDDVNAELERARERIARFVQVTDRPVKLDDQVNIDYAGFCEGEQFEGGTAEGQKLVIGSDSFIPGFEDQLIGATIGQTLDVNVTFPEAYHAENLAGKPAVFKVTVNGIEEKEVPELDDEFAKDVSECDSLAAYKAEIREKLEKEAQEKADAAFENEVIDTAVENAQVEIPDAMIEEQLDGMMRDMEMRMSYQGLKMADFLKYTGQTIEQMREGYKAQAQERVKAQLVLEAIRKAEGIEATDEEIEEALNEQAEQMKKTPEEVREMLGGREKAYFGDSITMKKTIQLLKDSVAAE
ncbi:MAG: trigger factor [Clostridia bacterium]